MSDDLKHQAGLKAVEIVVDGMRLGIGTGSTAEAFICVLAERIAAGLTIIGVPTSERTAKMCRELSVPLTTLAETPKLDLTIDGADEIDPQLNLIKGAGGALLREKIVASASNDMLVIADGSKCVEQLGAFPLPIEVTPFGKEATKLAISDLITETGHNASLNWRRDGADGLYVTDEGNHILDASFGRISSPDTLAAAFNCIPGVVETGLFTGLASKAIVATSTGIQIIHPRQ